MLARRESSINSLSGSGFCRLNATLRRKAVAVCPTARMSHAPLHSSGFKAFPMAFLGSRTRFVSGFLPKSHRVSSRVSFRREWTLSSAPMTRSFVFSFSRDFFSSRVPSQRDNLKTGNKLLARSCASDEDSNTVKARRRCHDYPHKQRSSLARKTTAAIARRGCRFEISPPALRVERRKQDVTPATRR